MNLFLKLVNLLLI